MTRDTYLRLPDALTPEEFLSRFWQKRPLFMRGALEGVEPSLEPGELAWLATLEDVESRLIFTDKEGSIEKYRVAHGPFGKDDLSSLPPQDWTLLVHDVEKHLPDFRTLFTVVNFIPDWRVDDLMVSFAAPGGSTGPHRDNYDVFLCQGEGMREWRLANEDDCTEDTSSGDLSLVEPFVDECPQTAANGDVLYLPPGVPHWGIALDSCMTYSIGMRAPSFEEITAAAMRLFDTSDRRLDDASPENGNVFYADPDLSTEEAVPGLISGAAIDRVKKMSHRVTTLDDQQIASVLGTVATETKAWLEPERLSGDEADHFIAALDGNPEWSVHGMARIAWCRVGGVARIFANGQSCRVSPDSLGIIRDLCRTRRASAAELGAPGEAGVLRWLLTAGVLDLTESSR